MSAERTLDAPTSAPPTGASDHEKRARYVIAALRIVLGFVLLWAFLDKIFGLGGPTPSERSVLSGASATQGYLSTVDGTFAGAFTAMAGHPVVDVLFLVAAGGAGLAFLLGIATRLAAAGAVAVMGPLYLSSLPLEQNPIVDQHLVYCLIAVGAAVLQAGDTLGFGRAWARTPLVRAVPLLR